MCAYIYIYVYISISIYLWTAIEVIEVATRSVDYGSCLFEGCGFRATWEGLRD